MASRVINKHKRHFVPFLYILAIIGCFIVAAGCLFYAQAESWLQDLPDYQDSEAYNTASKTRVYADDNTTLLAEFYLENREPVSSLDDISSYAKTGTIDTEDIRFYQHNGIDPIGIARALFVNATGGDREGASTITQQFVRNTILSDEASEQTIKRKVREAYISLKLEQVYSKDGILLMYLNTINYGSGAYGIEAASQKYFSKSSKDLTLAEAATLVGIPQSPTNNDPINHPDNCKKRRDLVLNRMLTNGDITQDQYDAAVNQPLTLNVSQNDDTNGIYKYPYFTSYVRQWLLDNYSEADVFKGGWTVTTTLDPTVQDEAEEAAREKEATVSSNLEVSLVAVDPQTGNIKALVGGKDYNENQYNLATQATRSPGSSFKTYTLLSSIENGVDPNKTYVNCSSKATIGSWNVENYDSTDYGTRSIASAFHVSSNTGFARLATMLGPDKVASMAEKCGVQTDLPVVPSITLGADDVTVRDMAEGYATIASGGIRHDTQVASNIVDSNGNVIYHPDTSGDRAIAQSTAKAAEKVMEGVLTSSDGTGQAARLSVNQPAAGKTGTSENFHDSWFCGITPQYSVAIWMGSRDQSPMDPNYTAASVFSSFLNQALAGQPTESFPMENAQDPDYKKLSDSQLQTLGGYQKSDSSSSSDSKSSSSSQSQKNSSGQSSSSSKKSSSPKITIEINGDDSASISSDSGSVTVESPSDQSQSADSGSQGSSSSQGGSQDSSQGGSDSQGSTTGDTSGSSDASQGGSSARGDTPAASR